MLNLYYRRLFILKLLFLHQALCLPVQNSSHIIYDQKQTGKYNIQISIKDVAIIEVDQNEFIDDTITNADDYYYDDDDLTINPISTWITSSTTTVKSPHLTSTTKEPSDVQLVTTKHEVNVLNIPHINTTNVDVEVLNQNFNSKDNSSAPSSAHTRSSISPEIALRLVKEPVVHDQKAIKTIPQLQIAQRSQEDTSAVTHVAPNKFQKVKEINSTILKIKTAQPLPIKQFAICKGHYLVDSNGNCRKKRRSSFLKSFLDVLKLMRMRET